MVFLLALAHWTAEHQRYAAALQQGWPDLHPSLTGIRLPVSSELTRASCPGFGGRTVFRHPCLQTRGGQSR